MEYENLPWGNYFHLVSDLKTWKEIVVKLPFDSCLNSSRSRTQ
jgi:hypothetical protein